MRKNMKMKMEWIKCAEGQMPEDDARYKGKKVINVLVTTNRGTVTKVQRQFIDEYGWKWGRILGEMKAWMPLPEPYEEK